MTHSATSNVSFSELKKVQTSIDRSNEKVVNEHINKVFTSLQKYKTRMILAALYQWYQKKPEYRSQNLQEFELTPRRNYADLNSKTSMKSEKVFGNKYALILLKFFKENIIFENEILKVVKCIVDLTKFEGRNNLGFSKLLNDYELELIKDVFKLLRNKCGTVKVIAFKYELEKTALDLGIQVIPIEDHVCNKPEKKTHLLFKKTKLAGDTSSQKTTNTSEIISSYPVCKNHISGPGNKEIKAPGLKNFRMKTRTSFLSSLPNTKKANETLNQTEKISKEVLTMESNKLSNQIKSDGKTEEGKNNSNVHTNDDQSIVIELRDCISNDNIKLDDRIDSITVDVSNIHIRINK